VGRLAFRNKLSTERQKAFKSCSVLVRCNQSSFAEEEREEERNREERKREWENVTDRRKGLWVKS